MKETIINHLIQQEKQLLDRMDTIDVLSDLIDDEFIEIGSSATVIDKAEVIRWFESKEQSKYSGTEFKAHPLAENLILLTYISAIEEEEPFKIKRAMRSSIWRLNNGTWRMVFHQGTPMKA